MEPSFLHVMLGQIFPLSLISSITTEPSKTIGIEAEQPMLLLIDTDLTPPLILLPMFEAALAGEISYGQNMSVPRVGVSTQGYF